MIGTMLKALRVITLIVVAAVQLLSAAGAVRVYPAPAGEELSTNYLVTVEGQGVPVYLAKVAPIDPARRWKAMDDKTNSANYFDLASFASFDMQGPVTVTVACPEEVQSAKILPTSAKIVPSIRGRTLTFTVPSPTGKIQP